MPDTQDILSRFLTWISPASTTFLIKAGAIYAPFAHTTKTESFIFGATATFFLICGKHLSKFSRPQSPTISQLTRPYAHTGYIIGLTLTALPLLAFLSIFILISCSRFIDWVIAPTQYLTNIFADVWATIYRVSGQQITFYLIGTTFGITAGIILALLVFPALARGQGLPDISELVRNQKQFKRFDPRPYFQVEKGVFIGKSDQKKPIYIPWAKLRETHIQIIGATGAGKGLLLTALSYQCILNEETLIWFDPKFDNYSCRLIRDAAEKVNRNFIFIDLNLEEPQINLLTGVSRSQLEELLTVGFGIKNKGTDGDFYRGQDEDAAYEASQIGAKIESLSLPNLYEACQNIESIVERENFWRSLRKISRLPAFNTNGGPDLTNEIHNGAAIYIVGSSERETVKMAQRMLLVRVMQIIKARNRMNRTSCHRRSLRRRHGKVFYLGPIPTSGPLPTPLCVPPSSIDPAGDASELI